MILLQSDLHDAWDGYKFAVNPDVCIFLYIYIQYQFLTIWFRQRGHVVIPFVPGYEDLAGKVLKLGHITDHNLRPLDDLFRDHFLHGVLKNMKGPGEPTWDHDDALGGGMVDL